MVRSLLARVSPSLLVVLVASASLGAGGCKIFKKQHPSGKLARTALPEQYTEEYPDQTSAAWRSKFEAGKTEPKSFDARDTGKLHVWLRYICTSRDGKFKLQGKLGYAVPGRPPVPPAAVTVTSEGTSMGSLPRGADAMIVINAPQPTSDRSAPGGMDTDGYIYLFDLDVATQERAVIDGYLLPANGERCFASSFEVWKD